MKFSGMDIGLAVAVGSVVGESVGLLVGSVVGATVGSCVGSAVGSVVGVAAGFTVGSGLLVGSVVGVFITTGGCSAGGIAPPKTLHSEITATIATNTPIETKRTVFIVRRFAGSITLPGPKVGIAWEWFLVTDMSATSFQSYFFVNLPLLGM